MTAKRWICTWCGIVCFAVLAENAIAESWPQCSVRAGGNGAPAILINGVPGAPLMFVANNQFNRDDILLDEIRQAAGAGVKIFGFNVPMDWDGAMEPTDTVIEKFCTANPDGYFYARIWVGAAEAWCKQHPEECITKATENADATLSLVPTGFASPASKVWREAARQRLMACVRHIAEGPRGKQFLGVCLSYLNTCEWFYLDTNEYMDYSPANLTAFRQWLKGRYSNEKALQSAWANPDTTFESAGFSTPSEREIAAWGPFRDPAKQQRTIDMHRFQSELIAETISYFASAVKEATHGRSLVGAFYGYSMELNGNGPRALANSGHLALAKLLECRDIDMIHAPLSYYERGLGQPGHFHAPVDSITLHGKLPVYEEDTYTHLAQPVKDIELPPGWKEATKTMGETLAVTRRNFGYSFTHGCGLWYFDLLSDGRWRDNTFWQSIPMLRRVAAELREYPAFAPEIAFVISEESPDYMRATTAPFLLQSMAGWRAEVGRIGAPVGYYLQSDLGRLPETVKVLILADPFVMRPDERAAVNRLLKRGGTVIWNYAPDIIGEKGIDVSRITACTGIQVEAKNDVMPMPIASAITEETATFDPKGWQPYFVVTSPKVDVVARYTASGEVCAAACKVGNGVNVYTATPRLPVGVLREICHRAGVHLYRDTPGMVGTVGSFLFVHTEKEGPITLSWPSRCRNVERLVPPSSLPMDLEEGRTWHDRVPAGMTAIYQCDTFEMPKRTNISGAR